MSKQRATNTPATHSHPQPFVVRVHPEPHVGTTSTQGDNDDDGTPTEVTMAPITQSNSNSHHSDSLNGFTPTNPNLSADGTGVYKVPVMMGDNSKRPTSPANKSDGDNNSDAASVISKSGAGDTASTVFSLTADGKKKNTPAARFLRRCHRNVCRMTVMITVFVPLVLVVTTLIVAALIAISGISSAGSLADKVMDNVLRDVITAVSGHSQKSVEHLLLLETSIRTGSVYEFWPTVQFMIGDYHLQGSSMLTMTSFQSNLSFFPLGYDGEVLIQSDTVDVVNRSLCNYAAIGTNVTAVVACTTLAAYDHDLVLLSKVNGATETAAILALEENHAFRITKGTAILSSRKPVNGLTIINVVGSGYQVVFYYAVPIYSPYTLAPIAVSTAYYLTTTISAMLLNIKVMENGMTAIVSQTGILVSASVNSSLVQFGTYHSLSDTMFSIRDLTAVPMISEGAKALLDHFQGNLSAMGSMIYRQSFYYGSTQGLLAASYLDFGIAQYGVQQIPVYCVVFVPYSEVYGDLWVAIRNAALIGAGIVLAVVFFVLFIAVVSFLKPLQHLTDDLRRLTTLTFETQERATPYSVFTEIREMQSTAIRLEEGLLAFAKYLPKTVVKILLRNNKFHHLGMTPKDVAIHFSDIVNFTGISESLSIMQLQDVIGEYLQEMSSVIISTNGTIDKFIGDAIMAFWNAPDSVANYRSQAVTAAVRCQHRLIELHAQWLRNSLPAIKCRVGINCGKVLVGNYGCDSKMDYTILGDPVNLASRLEGLNKKFETTIMIAKDVFTDMDVANQFCCRLLGRVAVKGKTQGVDVYEVIGFQSEIDAEHTAAMKLYTSAVDAFLARRFVETIEMLTKYPYGGKAAADLKAACQRYIREPPPTDWDGVEVLHEKF